MMKAKNGFNNNNNNVHMHIVLYDISQTNARLDFKNGICDSSGCRFIIDHILSCDGIYYSFNSIFMPYIYKTTRDRERAT